jgi:heat shock protein HslJ
MNYTEHVSEVEEVPTQGEEDRRVWIVIGGLAAILLACICVLGLVISYFAFFDEGSSTQPVPVEPGSVPLEAIQNINWHWAALAETEPAGQSLVPEPQNYLLAFQPEGQFIFRADCNVGSGTYAADGSNLALQLGAVTMADCGPASMSNEYTGLLGSVVAFGEQDGRLVLGLGDNVGLMFFDNGGASQPVGPSGAATPPPQPAQPTPTMGVLPMAIPRFPPEAGAGVDVILDGGQSQPGSSPIVRYTWEFGDGTTVEGATVSHAYAAPGVYAVTLAVVAEDGLGSSATGQIVVTQDQPPAPTQPPEPSPTAGQGGALVGPTWRWSELIEEGEPTIIPTAQTYTLKFEPDLTLQVTADCNSGTGLYAVDGDRIRLNVSGVSQTECAADSLAQQYLELLSSVDEYELDEGLLLLYPSEGADRMVFAP